MIKQRDNYKFCTNCRAELVQQDDFKACQSWGKHYYFNAKPAVGIVISNDNNQILLVKRAREPFKDWWDVPGGFVEEGETLEQATLRELKEETGLDATNITYIGSFAENYHYQDEVVPLVAAVFTGNVEAGAAEVKVADDVSDYKFVPKKDIQIDTIAFKNQREFLKKFLHS